MIPQNRSNVKWAVLAATVFMAGSALADVNLTATARDTRRLVNVNLTTNTVTTIKNTTGFPDSMVYDALGRIIYDEADTNTVHRYDPATSTDIIIADDTKGINIPADLALSPDGSYLLVSNFGAQTITKTLLTAGFPTTVLVNAMGPEGLAFDASGRLYALIGYGTADSRLVELNPSTGAILRSSIAFDPTFSLDGLTFDPFSGLLYATSMGGNALYSINPATLAATKIGTIPSPDGVITDSHGTLYIAARGDFRVYSYTIATATVTALTPVPGIDDLGAVILTPPSITKAFSPATIFVGGTSTLTFVVTNPNAVLLNNVNFVDALPAGIQVSATPAVSGTCGGGTITAVAGAGTVSLANANIPASSNCTFSVSVTGVAASPIGAPFNNCVTASATNAGPGAQSCATLTVTVAPQPPNITKTFSPLTTPLNGNTTLTFLITNPVATAVTGVAFADTLPAGVVVATPPNVSGACGGGTITATAGSGSVTLAGATLAGSANCTFSVSVTGTTLGLKTNTVLVTSDAGPGNSSSASFTVLSAPGISKAFGAATIPLNGGTSLSFTVTNANTVALTGVAFTDTLPAGLTVATPNGLSGSCGGGTITAAAGGTSVTLSGATLPASGSCTFSLNVTGTAAGVQNNTTSSVTSTNGGTGPTATATVTVVAPGNIVKTFGASSIAQNTSTTLTFLINNPNAATTLNASFTDTLPAGLVVATPPALSGTCGAGATITANAGGTSVTLAGGSIAGGGSCTLTVNVTGVTPSPVGPPPVPYNNCVTVNSTNGGNGNTSCATLAVLAPTPATITKTFGAPTVLLNGTTTLNFTITNSGPVALTAVAFTDALPAGLTVSTPNGLNPGTGCNGTVPTAVAGSGTVSLTGASLGVGASCTFAVNVTGIAAGVQNNSVMVNSSGGAGNTSTATVTVIAPPGITKSFGAPSMPLNGSTTLSFTVTNSNTTTALNGLAFTDTLPVGLSIATPNGLSGSCGGGTIIAAAGSTSVSLTGATLAASASCTFSITVNGVAVGTQNNTTSAITSTNGGSGAPATATTLVVGPPAITKAFTPNAIIVGAMSQLTFTISNANAGAPLNGVAFTDTLPAGVVIATPNGLTGSCGGGTITAGAGLTTISLTGATLPASGSCTFSVNVNGTGLGMPLTNTTSQVSSTNGGNGAPATAMLTVTMNPIPTLDDTFQLRYAANLNIGDSFVNVTNAGTLSGNDPTGRICVNVYTFDPAEELVSCCACPVTPNGLASLSVRNDLISNTLTPGVPTSVTIKLLASTPVAGACNAASPTASNLARGMRAWGTTIHSLSTAPASYGVSETPFTISQLSPTELAKLSSFCGFIQAVGSGFGICNSCRSGALGGATK